jgi:glutathione synthase/RimK-type ligase-like ATP-grasp enzyme
MLTAKKPTTTELLFASAEKMGWQPAWVTPRGLFAVTINGRERYINFAHSPLNSHTSISLAKNKYLTRLVLERHGLRNIPFARPRSLEAAVAFLDTHQKIIVKPVNGAGARDIHIVTDASQLTGLKIRRYIFEKYIAGQELRYLVLNDRVVAVYRSDYGVSVDEKRYLECVSFPENEWDEALCASSIQAARALGLAFAAVDYLATEIGETFVLEINSAPDLKWFHTPASGPAVDVAQLFLNTYKHGGAPI